MEKKWEKMRKIRENQENWGKIEKMEKNRNNWGKNRGNWK